MRLFRLSWAVTYRITRGGDWTTGAIVRHPHTSECSKASAPRQNSLFSLLCHWIHWKMIGNNEWDEVQVAGGKNCKECLMKAGADAAQQKTEFSLSKRLFWQSCCKIQALQLLLG